MCKCLGHHSLTWPSSSRQPRTHTRGYSLSAPSHSILVCLITRRLFHIRQIATTTHDFVLLRLPIWTDTGQARSIIYISIQWSRQCHCPSLWTLTAKDTLLVRTHPLSQKTIREPCTPGFVCWCDQWSSGQSAGQTDGQIHCAAVSTRIITGYNGREDERVTATPWLLITAPHWPARWEQIITPELYICIIRGSTYSCTITHQYLKGFYLFIKIRQIHSIHYFVQW